MNELRAKARRKKRDEDIQVNAIEQNADLVGLLYRTAYYAESEQEKEAEAGKAELVLAINRNGKTGHIPLTFIAALMRFGSGPPARDMAET